MGFIFGTIFSSIVKAFIFIFKAIISLLTKLIKSLNLSLPFLYLFVGLILFLTKTIKVGSDAYYIFAFGFVVILIASIILTVKKLLFPKQKTKKQNETHESIALKKEPSPLDYINGYDKPSRIYRVASDMRYVVVEYYDRNEIFREEGEQLVFVRKDTKGPSAQPL